MNERTSHFGTPLGGGQVLAAAFAALCVGATGCVADAPSGRTSENLSALTSADIEAAPLGGELGCSFVSGDDSVLLLAMGVVASSDPAQGLVKPGGSVQRVTAPGGFDAMLGGATFEGDGLSVRVEPTGQATAGGESPPRPANLVYERSGGAPVTVSGRWECGP